MNESNRKFPFDTEIFSQARSRLVDKRFSGPDGRYLKRDRRVSTQAGLAKMALTIGRNLNAAKREFDCRLNRDRQDLFPFVEEEKHIHARWIVQESHNGQRRPIVVWHAEPAFVYKPRPLEIDAGWSYLLSWFEESIGDRISHPISMLARRGYGWSSFVRQRPCDSKRTADRFYWRLGALASLLWAIGGCDASSSNIVASGGFPTLIDSEMVLQPGSVLYADDIGSEFRAGGILPVVTADMDGRVIGIGAAARKGVSCRHATVKDFCRLCHHVPLVGKDAWKLDGREDLLQSGFKAGINAIAMNRVDCVSKSGPLEGFERADCRIAIRPTVVYEAILRWIFRCIECCSVVPDIESLLNELPLRPNMGHIRKSVIVEAERQALMVGDIPMFTMRLTDRNMFVGKKIGCSFRYSGMERAKQRVNALSQEECNMAYKAWVEHVDSSRLYYLKPGRH